ncbi:MAG: ATP-binding protein [Ignavibacteria bacterium]|jgi:NAD-dependent dihydropyrimidine dehydrogenase PreA subunit
MKRTIITIDEAKCNGCEECVNGCHEGALQMIDGKARLVSELFCDGLGACIGTCPEGAIILEEREAEPYSELAVIERISKLGEKVILAHLKHLKDHNEMEYFKEGVEYLKTNNVKADLSSLFNQNINVLSNNIPQHTGCPGSKERAFVKTDNEAKEEVSSSSELTHWPIQLHLANPSASHFNGCDLLLAADCVPFSISNFHSRFLKNKKLVIACPKLDSNKEVYSEKLRILIDESKINTLHVVIMEVPCCGGLLQLAENAVASSTRKVPVKYSVVGVQGDVIEEEWL